MDKRVEKVQRLNREFQYASMSFSENRKKRDLNSQEIQDIFNKMRKEYPDSIEVTPIGVGIFSDKVPFTLLKRLKDLLVENQELERQGKILERDLDRLDRSFRKISKTLEKEGYV